MWAITLPCFSPEKVQDVSQKRFLQIRSFFWNDRPFHWADLQTNTAVYACRKVNPLPVVNTLNVFARAWVNASNGAGIDASSKAFAYISNDCVRHK